MGIEKVKKPGPGRPKQESTKDEELQTKAFYITRELGAKVERLAKVSKRSQSEVVRQSLVRFFDELENEKIYDAAEIMLPIDDETILVPLELYRITNGLTHQAIYQALDAGRLNTVSIRGKDDVDKRMVSVKTKDPILNDIRITSMEDSINNVINMFMNLTAEIDAIKKHVGMKVGDTAVRAKSKKTPPK